MLPPGFRIISIRDSVFVTAPVGVAVHAGPGFVAAGLVLVIVGVGGLLHRQMNQSPGLQSGQTFMSFRRSSASSGIRFSTRLIMVMACARVM